MFSASLLKLADKSYVPFNASARFSDEPHPLRRQSMSLLGSTPVIENCAANLRFGSILLKNSTSDWLGACSWVVDARVDEGLEASCGHNWRRDGNQLGQFPQILRRGGEEELVAGAGGTA